MSFKNSCGYTRNIGIAVLCVSLRHGCRGIHNASLRILQTIQVDRDIKSDAKGFVVLVNNNSVNCQKNMVMNGAPEGG